jgi:hypothetical protein
MSYEVGGRADKNGNRYEIRWVIYQMMTVLEERIESVTLEALGDDEKGVDVWIFNNDGTREAQQCKGRNGSREAWNQRDESIDAQLRAAEEFAKANNFSIVKTYIDRAKSATSDRRPEFQNMIRDSASGLFDICIVHKLDRFSRDKYDSAVYKRKLRANGVRLVSILENLDGSPESVILESVIEGMAEYYS